MKAIEISNLSKTFKGKRGTSVEALKNLTLDIAAGEIFGFLGPNGAGKSTTIKALMGLITPTSGEARIMGLDVKSHLSRSHVGYLPENPAFFDYLTAEEYLVFVGRTFGMAESLLKEKTESVLKYLELWEARKRPMRGYSKGMVQRVGLAQVLIHDPDVYILDEPMSGLDPLGRALVKDVILDLKSRGKCVFFSTHIIADVETICDRVGIIVKGVLQSVKEVQAVISNGIEGYHVLLAAAGPEQKSEEFYVTRKDVADFITASKAKGLDIIMIEPKRKSLEEFFLGIVKDK